jgi:hypothetical protein
MAASEVSGGALAERAGNGGLRLAVRYAGPIAVDETVLNCCNRAWEIARFHAAPDVRLEHLLHALTRVGPAAEALGELGIRVDGLRRDTAVAIAADLPANPLEGDASPQTSGAFEQVLRGAADLAGRRAAAAGVHDLIRALLTGGAGSPGAALLIKAAADPQRLERWRDAPLRAALNSPGPEAMAGVATGPLAPDLSDAVIARLDAMAATLQGLEAQVTADRQALGDLSRSVQSALQALGGEGAPAAGAGSLDAVEALAGRLGELDRRLVALGNGLGSLDRFASTSDAWRELRERLEAMEGRLGAGAADLTNRLAQSLSQRLEGTQTSLEHLEDETAKHWSSHGERQITLEGCVRAQLESAEAAGKTHERDFKEISQSLVKLGATQQTLGDNLTGWRIESGGDLSIISNRLEQLERTLFDGLGQLGAELRAWQENREAGRIDRFKRWLYGTAKVFPWREEATLTGQASERGGGAKADTTS